MHLLYCLLQSSMQTITTILTLTLSSNAALALAPVHSTHNDRTATSTSSTCLFMSQSDNSKPPKKVNLSPTPFSSSRKATQKFLRIQPKRSRNNKRRVFELQTAVATLGKKNEDGTEVIIDLHAQLHFGEREYFQFYNNDVFVGKYDNVF